MGRVIQPHTPTLLYGAYSMARRAAETRDERATGLDAKVSIYGAVFFAAAYLESWINEFFEMGSFLEFEVAERFGQEALTRVRTARDEGVMGKSARTVLRRHRVQEAPASLMKYDLAHRLLTGKPIDRSMRLWAEATALVKLRHEFVHPVPDVVRIDIHPEIRVTGPGRVEGVLRSFVRPNPAFVGVKTHPSTQFFWKETARWAARVADDFVTDFQKTIGAPRLPSGIEELLDRPWLRSGPPPS